MKKTYIIAEIGNTHEGVLGLALQFIDTAADCGVDAVKFQTHIFEAESLPDAPNPPYFQKESRREYFERTAFSLAEWIELKRFAEKDCGIGFLSSPFSLEAVDLLEQVGVDTYKIPSGEVSNLPLLVKVAETGKKVLLSSGMSTWEDLDEAVKALKSHGCKDLVVMQCTSEYPCPPEDSGLNVMEEMSLRYKAPVGYSDHTMGEAVALAAVVLGATVVEKHFTLSRNMYGSDAKYSVEPAELKRLVENIRTVEKALQHKTDKDRKAGTLAQMKAVFEKSIVSACDIAAGETICPAHLAYKKPGDGIPAGKVDAVIGKRVRRALPRNHQLHWDDFD